MSLTARPEPRSPGLLHRNRPCRRRLSLHQLEVQSLLVVLSPRHPSNFALPLRTRPNRLRTSPPRVRPHRLLHRPCRLLVLSWNSRAISRHRCGLICSSGNCRMGKAPSANCTSHQGRSRLYSESGKSSRAAKGFDHDQWSQAFQTRSEVGLCDKKSDDQASERFSHSCSGGLKNTLSGQRSGNLRNASCEKLASRTTPSPVTGTLLKYSHQGVS
mmetsp:Transcript_13611/g.41050  ORF Transcript_13611/g.41050 Transcript_13611/m.41050 type:complete len:215 (+) Transcript_13611:560-1204(+)